MDGRVKPGHNAAGTWRGIEVGMAPRSQRTRACAHRADYPWLCAPIAVGSAAVA